MTRSQRTLFIHIGLPKTGSTWLQQWLFPPLDHLFVQTVPRSRLFKTPEDAEQQHRVFACVLRRSAAIWRTEGNAIFRALLGEGAAASSTGADTLLSDEAIGRAASRPEALTAHLLALHEVATAWGFHRLKILALVRRQDTWLASHYAQVSDRKLGAGQTDFERFVAKTTDTERERYGFGMLLDYAALHDALCDVTGPDDVSMLPFEWFREAPSSALEHVLRWLETPANAVPRVLASALPKQANVRSQAGDNGLSWQLRPPSMHIRGARRRLWPSQAWPRRAKRLTPCLSQRVLSIYATVNTAFAEKTSLNLAAYGYAPSPTPTATKSTSIAAPAVDQAR